MDVFSTCLRRMQEQQYEEVIIEEPALLINSLWCIHDDSTILNIIDTEGTDVNVKDPQCQSSPLHLAVNRKSPTVAHKLIQKGADLNARDAEYVTPLHYAVKSRDNNNEIVHLLLYYGADVSTKCCKRLHPFGHALFAHKFELALILANYYDVEDLREDVHLFFVHDSPSVLSLIPLDVFKLIWPLLDQRSFDKIPTFMTNYLRLYKHTNWIEGMYIILESDYAFQIINEWTSRNDTWLYTLLNAFDKRQIALHDRLTIIYKFLNMSIKLHVHDLCYIYDVCGFNEIFEATLYCGSFCDCEHDPCINICSPIDTFILVRDENYKIETTSKLFKNMLLLSSRHFRKSNRMLNALNYFSLPLYVKYELLEICKKTFISEEYEQIATKLQSVPEMPTLIELCRNAIRTSVKPKQLRQLYHFYDNVNKLELPSKLRDIIIFKASPF